MQRQVCGAVRSARVKTTTSPDSKGHSPRRLTVVVGLDLSDADGPACAQAIRIARSDRLSALHVISVFDPEPSVEGSNELAGRLRRYVKERAVALGGLRGIRVAVHLRTGGASRQILRLADEVASDVVVVGSHREPQVKRAIVGSTARQLIGASRCPVVVASPWPTDPSEPREPVIEPPCPECVRSRAASRGSRWWCDWHRSRGEGMLCSFGPCGSPVL
jgi:nucleotide-binding universal stress UspA family protein